MEIASKSICPGMLRDLEVYREEAIYDDRGIIHKAFNNSHQSGKYSFFGFSSLFILNT